MEKVLHAKFAAFTDQAVKTGSACAIKDSAMHLRSPACLVSLLLAVLPASIILAQIPSQDITRLILADLKSWELTPSETASLEIAEGYASPLLLDDEGQTFAAFGQRNEGSRIVVYADRACFNLTEAEAPTQTTVLNSIRWAGKNKAPTIGLGDSLKDLVPLFQEAGLRAVSLSTADLVDQVDVYCLAVRPRGGVFGEGRKALEQFVANGGGLVLAGTGPQDQMEFFNTLISPAGIRFKAAAKANGLETVALTPALQESSQMSTRMTSGSSTIREVEPLQEREPIELPSEAEGPIGAALKLTESANRSDRSLIQELRQGAGLSGDDLAVFQEALFQLNHAVGPIIPTKEEPIMRGADPLVDAIMEIETELNDTLPAEQLRAIPGADNYPGAVPEDAPRVAKTVEIDVNYKGWLPRHNGGGARADEQRPTGLYAAPGELVRVTVPANLADKGLKVIVGGYGGTLSENWDQWKRYPSLLRRFPIESKSTLVANGLGGLITIAVPRSMKGEEPDWVEIEIEGAVEAPLFVLGKTDLTEWMDEIRKRPAPWGEVASERMILMVPSENLRDLRNPDEVMDFWNQIVDSTAELAVLDRNQFRAERIVFDRQLSNPGVGLHAGQPIAAHTGRAAETALSPDLLREGRAWGFLHELGHVHQDAAWNLPGSVEASCNLWSVYVSEELLGVPRAEAHRTTDPLTRRATMNAYFRDGAKFETNWEREKALESYLQIQEAFGWEVYKEVLASYHDYEDRPRVGDQQSINDEWVEKMSEACGVNLAPFYQTWGLPLSDQLVSKLAKLPEWEEDPTKRFRNQ